MGLQYPPEWRFDNVGEKIPAAAVGELIELLERAARSAPDMWAVYEIVKRRFGAEARSSSEGWARKDMSDALQSEGARGVAEYVDMYWMALQDLSAAGVQIPNAEQVNLVLRKHAVGYAIKPPLLVREVGGRALTKPTEAMPIAIGGGYVLGERIGHGGYGDVYKATRGTQFGEFVYAVKVHSPSAFVDHERALKRFGREVEALRRLQHRAIVPYVDAGLDGEGRPFLVMPHVEGSDLRAASERYGMRDRVRLVLEVLHGIEYAHMNNVLHRDLKPSNILVRHSDAQPVVVDFGLAYFYEEADQESLTATGIGTGAYVPIEVFRNPKERSPLHDVFSSGVILYEVLARRLPDFDNYVPLAQYDPVLARLEPIFQSAVAPKARRFQSVAEFRRALEAAIAT